MIYEAHKIQLLIYVSLGTFIEILIFILIFMVIKTITFQQTENFTVMTMSKVVQNWKHGE
jgi:flagellar biosynthesis/type III secretory pathway M-ring protein FliF/YscJ